MQESRRPASGLSDFCLACPLAQRSKNARTNPSAIFAAWRPSTLRVSQQAAFRPSFGAAHRFYVAGGLSKDAALGDPAKVASPPNESEPDSLIEVKPNETGGADEPLDPKAKAMSLLDAVPTNSILSKSAVVATGVGFTIFLVSKEIYILNADTVLLAAFSAVVYLGFKYLTEPAGQFILDRNHHIWGIQRDARIRHRSIVQSRLDEVDRMSDIVDVTKNMFEMSKDMAKLEAQSFELKQKLALYSEIKAVLDSWVRHETAVRQREQSEIAHTVVQRVRKSLTDAALQEQILQQAVADVERLVARK
ncbi:MAG: hypothetical protein BJ554DRAFT_3673 [Olpidium bornovanus]|uniref:ATP synthase subunit 4 n=1 Tax=Olpidium bornovanus TaxID=278681 RepID=A0A8H8A2M7_9FUNG|nr:MAG: hypothetical protein BJ554DRAFT_3673 [Olpidium bornovanus]